MQQDGSNDNHVTEDPIPDFSDYVVYVDESGDHSLTHINERFPVFCLSFCIIRKEQYISHVVPAIQRIKFKYWGHDAVILHEREIRKQENDFSWLMAYPKRRENFLSELHDAISSSPINLISCVIKKNQLVDQYSYNWNPYDIALNICLEDLHEFLMKNAQKGKAIQIIFESRGKKEDNELKRSFQRIIGREDVYRGRSVTFEGITYESKFAKKFVNSAGLQLADLTARPLALRVLRPTQENRTQQVLKGKIIVLKECPANTIE